MTDITRDFLKTENVYEFEEIVGEYQVKGHYVFVDRSKRSRNDSPQKVQEDRKRKRWGRDYAGRTVLYWSEE